MGMRRRIGRLLFGLSCREKSGCRKKNLSTLFTLFIHKDRHAKGSCCTLTSSRLRSDTLELNPCHTNTQLPFTAPCWAQHQPKTSKRVKDPLQRKREVATCQKAV